MGTVELNEAFFQKAAGWEVMRHARALLAADRVPPCQEFRQRAAVRQPARGLLRWELRSVPASSHLPPSALVPAHLLHV